MASLISHPVVALGLAIARGSNGNSWRLLVMSVILTLLPDADGVAFVLGIPYESPWGHRGFTHSILFGLVIAFICCLFNNALRVPRWTAFWVCAVAILSHTILDSMTNGGLGVAFFWPLDNTRYFLPWQVIQVSPISWKRFLTTSGVRVLSSELYYVWLPILGCSLLWRFLSTRFGKRT